MLQQLVINCTIKAIKFFTGSTEIELEFVQPHDFQIERRKISDILDESLTEEFKFSFEYIRV